MDFHAKNCRAQEHSTATRMDLGPRRAADAEIGRPTVPPTADPHGNALARDEDDGLQPVRSTRPQCAHMHASRANARAAVHSVDRWQQSACS